LPGFKSGYQPVAKLPQLCIAFVITHSCENEDPRCKFRTKRRLLPAAHSKGRSVPAEPRTSARHRTSDLRPQCSSSHETNLICQVADKRPGVRNEPPWHSEGARSHSPSADPPQLVQVGASPQ
jgi:hypothetical protein